MNLRTVLSAQMLALVFVTGGADAQTVEIWEIQGDGMTSPLEGQRVTTEGNVVTAVGDEVFFIQSPDAQTDGDPWTSDGIAVDLGQRPTVSVGDVVDVTGTVRESFGQTEIAGDPTVTVTASNRPRPTAAEFDGETPTPFQPWPETELERFEGMWVRVRSGVVSEPSDGFGEACVTAAERRLFREPGISYPGLPGLAVWDGNPEGFEIDPYGLGDGFDLAAGTSFQATGVLAYAFGAYQLWPVTFTIVDTPGLPRAVRPRRRGEVTVATQNLFRLGVAGDDVPYQDRLAKLSRQIRDVLGAPDILAVQEALDVATLEDLADRIESDDPGVRYDAHLIEGNDFGGIDVGFLVRDAVDVLDVEQVGEDERFTWDNSFLFDRPPLVLEAGITVAGQSFDLTVVSVHLRSLSGIDDPVDGERIRQKRFEQSVWLSEWIQERQGVDPIEPLVVLGDFNAFEFSDGYVDVMGQVTGIPDADGALLPATEEIDPALLDWAWRLSPTERYTFVYQCSAEVLDHVVTNRAATGWVTGFEAARGNADSPHDLEFDPSTAARSSDHDGLVIYLGSKTRLATGPRFSPVIPGKTVFPSPIP